MNERIKELDKQAKIWAMDNTNFPISSHIPAGYTEKFAELIVRECVRVGGRAFLHDNSKVPTFPSNQILEHFGVE